MSTKTVKLAVELPEDQAYALAELCKRLTMEVSGDERSAAA